MPEVASEPRGTRSGLCLTEAAFQIAFLCHRLGKARVRFHVFSRSSRRHLENRRMRHSSKRVARGPEDEIHELSAVALHACSIASDEAFNVKDFLVGSSQMACLAVRDWRKRTGPN